MKKTIPEISKKIFEEIFSDVVKSILHITTLAPLLSFLFKEVRNNLILIICILILVFLLFILIHLLYKLKSKNSEISSYKEYNSNFDFLLTDNTQINQTNNIVGLKSSPTTKISIVGFNDKLDMVKYRRNPSTSDKEEVGNRCLFCKYITPTYTHSINNNIW